MEVRSEAAEGSGVRRHDVRVDQVSNGTEFVEEQRASEGQVLPRSERVQNGVQPSYIWTAKEIGLILRKLGDDLEKRASGGREERKG